MSEAKRLRLLIVLAGCLLAARPVRAESVDSRITVLAVRHAETEPGFSGPDSLAPLSDEGQDRADELARMLGECGLTAIYATGETRARETAQPIAEDRGLPIDSYRSAAGLAGRLLNLKEGTILVVGDAGVPAELARLMGVSITPQELDGYDDLLVITRYEGSGAARTSLLNLSYGRPGSSEIAQSRCDLPTAIMIATFNWVPSGDLRALELRRTLAKARVSTVYSDKFSYARVQPLTRTQGLTIHPLTYEFPRQSNLTPRLTKRAGPTLAVALRATLFGLVSRAGATPLPVLNRIGQDDLFIMTLPPGRCPHLLHLKYGRK